MTWFKVDDHLHAHPKVLATSLAALGLWSVAGSWSSNHLTDGFLPDHVVPLLSRGTSELADELVATGLWRRVRGGYLFHEWEEDGDGTRRNPTKEEVTEQRRKRAEAGRKGGLASRKTRSKPKAPTQANAEADASAVVEPPSRPVPIDYPPNPPLGGGNDVHDPANPHPNCRQCGTNPRGKPKPKHKPDPRDEQQRAMLAKAEENARRLAEQTEGESDDMAAVIGINRSRDALRRKDSA